MMRWMQVQSVVIESIDASFVEYERISQEFASIEKRLSSKIEPEVYKLTFLRLKIDDSAATELKSRKVSDAANDDFLGYAIVVNLVIKGHLQKSYIFEAIIRDLFPCENTAVKAVLPASLPSHFLHVRRQFKCFVVGKYKDYNLIGSFFRQQNTITNVCAHACALMMLNNCNEIEPLVTCEDINRILGVDHEKRALIINTEYGNNDYATEDGIGTSELCEKVFTHFGFKPYKYNQIGFREFLYGFVESAYPALLTFSTPRTAHVVAVVGHTWNPHSWFPHAFPSYSEKPGPKRYLSSLSWVNDFLVHDDNFGMQLSLPAHCFSSEEQPGPGKGFTLLEAIGIFPQQKNIRLLAPLVEKTALKMLHQVLRMFYSDGNPPPKENYYVNHLLEHILRINAPTVVLRTSLVERLAYLEHLKCQDNKGKHYSEASRSTISKELEKFERFWLVEVTEPALYVGNLSKVIDVIINPKFDPGTPEKPADNRQALIMLRFPEFLLQPKEFRPNNVEYYPTKPLLHVEGHLPLFRQ
jgi:hypothetical protein